MGRRGELEQTPLSFASLVLVAYIRLPETRSNGVVSMHECYTYFLSMFRKDSKCFFACSINDIQKSALGRGGGREWAAREQIKPCSSVAEFFKFFGRDVHLA